jgi:phosphoribosylglycinamide formyltransferase-1
VPAPADPAPPAPRSILEAIQPHPGSFDTTAMARGEPGVPRRFDWRGRTYEVAEVLGTGREIENASGTTGDSYVRRHVFRVRTTSGEILVLAGARAKNAGPARWLLRSIEGPAAPPA